MPTDIIILLCLFGAIVLFVGLESGGILPPFKALFSRTKLKAHFAEVRERHRRYHEALRKEQAERREKWWKDVKEQWANAPHQDFKVKDE